MLDNTVVRWVVLVAAVLALVALIAYVRGDDSDNGRSPEPGDALPALIQGANTAGVAGV